MAETELPTPPGYQKLIPFDKGEHRNLGLKTGQGFAFSASLHAIYISAVEFLQAARHFPIVFSLAGDEGDVVPMAITGLKAKQNLFLKEDGSWPDGTYIPAYLRRYPFYTAQVKRGEQTEEHMICVDPAGLTDSTDDNKPLMDAKGNTTKEWTRLEGFIRDMEKARQQTQSFTTALREHDLLETFEAQVRDKGGPEYRLSGMLRVSEEKLRKLDCDSLQMLMSKDYLFLIHLHRMSLDNFRLLLDRASIQGKTSS